jgi:hypothetical protein
MVLLPGQTLTLFPASANTFVTVTITWSLEIHPPAPVTCNVYMVVEVGKATGDVHVVQLNVVDGVHK